MIWRSENRLSIVSMLIVGALFIAGCAQREAQQAIEQAQQAKQEAENAQAPVYTPDEFNEANRLINLAQSQFDGGEYEEAISTAQQAAASFNDAVNNVAPVRERVQAEWDEIDSLITQAEENIQTARAQGVVTSEEINPVDERVTQLRQRFVDDISREIDQEVLDSFKAEVQDVLQETESLATAHLRPQATDLRDQLQQLVNRAEEFKANEYLPEDYNIVTSQFDRIIQAYNAGRWQEVIDQAQALMPEAESLVQRTQQQAAGDILANLRTEIEQAMNANIPVDAYNQALNAAMQAVNNGEQAFNQENFGQAIAATDEANAQLDIAFQALQTQAEQLITQARQHIQEAQQLEGAQYAQSQISTANKLIEESQEQIDNEAYIAAFREAALAEDQARQAIDEAKSGKAREELRRVESPFSTLSSQGGAQYVPEAYQEAQSAVQDLRNKLQEGQYQAVEEGVDPALEVVQNALNELESTSQEFITRAEEAIQAAREANAPEWVSMQFANAQNLKAAAESELQNQRFQAVIRNANQAIDAARNATGRAYQLQAQENIRKANDLIALAVDANQKELSPLAYRHALDARDQVQELLNNQQYKRAYEQSLVAVQRADRAYNNMIMTAQEKTDSALQAEAMDYSRAEIERALVLLTEAEEAQEAKRYEEANQKAQQAIDLAEEAEYFTWKQRSFDLIRRLEGLKETLEAQNAHIIAPGPYQKALAAFAEAKVAQIDNEFARAYQQADRAQDIRNEIWAQMKSQLEQIVGELRNLTKWMGENAMDEEGREVKIKLMNDMVELERQMALENWKNAFELARQVNQAAQTYSDKFKNHNLSVLAARLQSALSQYRKQDALTIVPEEQQQFKQTVKTLRSPKQTTYAEAFQQYQEASNSVENLPDSIATQAQQRTEEIASILQQADEAGAQRFFSKRYDKLARELQWLRNSIRGNDYEGIADRLKHLERKVPELLEETQIAAAENDYLENLQLSLNQANNLLQDFGPTNLPRELFLESRVTEHQLDAANVDMYRSLQGKLTAKSLRINAEILENRIKGAEPPRTLSVIHRKARKSFELFREASEAFELYGRTDLHDIEYREKRLVKAYDKLEKSMKINADLQFAIDNHRELGLFEGIKWQIQRFNERFADWYYNYQTE